MVTAVCRVLMTTTMFRSLLALTLLLTALSQTACDPAEPTAESQNEDAVQSVDRLVTLHGTLTEIVASLGLRDRLVAVDVTSTYPPAVDSLPDMGYHSFFSAEGILAQDPDRVLGIRDDMDPTLVDQLEAAGVDVVLFDRATSVDEAQALIREVGDVVGMADAADDLAAGIEADLDGVDRPDEPVRALFIYARGAGSLTVAGDDTPVHHMIELAGGENAVSGFDGYKPLTAEALIAADPDAIILFTHGLASLGGMDGLLQVPGVAETTAGQTRHIIEMDALYLSGFGPRMGRAVQDLAQALR